MTFIELFDRTDRLGTNIISYIAQLLYAHYNGYYIQYIRENLHYNDSMFVACIFDLIDEHNRYLISKGYSPYINDTRVDIVQRREDLMLLSSTVVLAIGTDLFTYFKAHFGERAQEILAMHAQYRHYTKRKQFDPDITTVVHLRLEDVENVPDYDGRISSNYFRSKIDRCIPCGVEYYRPYNCQAPLVDCKINNAIRNISKDNSIVIIASPQSTIKTVLDKDIIKDGDKNYMKIQSADEDYDLYLMSTCKYFIASRSTYPISALFFGKHSIVYVPMWGHIVSTGLYTKYDKTPYKYFF